MGNQSSCFHEGQGPCGENNSGEPASQLCQFGVKSEESCKEQKSECEIVNSLSCIEGFEVCFPLFEKIKCNYYLQVFVNNYGIGKIIKIKQEKDHHYIEIMVSVCTPVFIKIV